MSDDLDKLEAIARATESVHPGPWNGWLYSGDGPVSRSVHGGFAPIVHELPEKDSGGEELAEHIAAFSPDVVLRLIARVRQAEDSVRYLWSAWAEAEGRGQPKRAVFGVPETYGDPDFERLGAPAEVQQAVSRIVKP